MMKDKRLKSWQRVICGLLSIVFLLNISLDLTINAVYAAGSKEAEIPSIGLTFEQQPLSGGNMVSSGIYLVSKDSAMVMTARFTPNFTDGYVTGAYIELNLPYLYRDENGKLLISDTKPANVPEDELMGIECLAPSDMGDWVVDTSQGEAGQDGYRRGTMRIKAFNETVHTAKAKSFDLTFRFFGDIPENESASVKLGAGYEYYYDTLGNQSAHGYVIEPGAADPSGDNSALRIINMVNSNLLWEPEISQVGTSVLWDKYNYLVYKVKVSNNSQDTGSMIDHYTLILSTQSDITSEGKGGVLERDMMQWEYQPGSDPIKNDDISDEARKKTFVGVPNQGGVLIYDVTDISEEDRKDLDLVNFSNLGETLPYNYSSAGVIGVPITGDEGKLYPPSVAGEGKYSSREYYIAVPYPNNFRGSLDCVSNFRPTIFFGGRDLAWTKETGDYTAHFVKKDYQFNHHKYVLEENESTPVEDKEVAIGSTDSYYLDGFDNTGNVPVFNAVTTDTLPDQFDLTQIQITLNKENEDHVPVLSDWFAKQPILFEFLNETGDVVEVSAQDLGIALQESTDPSGNVTWTLETTQAINNFLANPDHTDWKFNKKFKVCFKERIEAGETFNGRITVTGEVNQLLTYLNQINTDYEHWYYRLATADEKEGYEVEKKTLSTDEASLIARRAKPLIETYGVLRENGVETPGEVNKAQDVPLNQDASSIRYVLGNDSDSKMYPGILTVGPLLTVGTDGSYTGLLVNELRFSKALVDHAEIDSITLTDEKGNKIVVPNGNLSINQDGEILLSQTDWKKLDEEKNFGTLYQVQVDFKEFDGNVALQEGAFVDLRGTANRTGMYNANAVWSTSYQVSGMPEDTVTGTAHLNVLEIQPVVTGTANYNGQSSKTLTVPNKVDGFYEFAIENHSKSAAGKTEVTFEIKNVGDKNNDPDHPQVQGFDTDKIVIGKNYQKSGTINRIELYDWDQNPETDDPKASFTLSELQADHLGTDGSLELTRDDFKQISRLKFVRIVYDNFDKMVVADSDPEVDSALRVLLYGNVDWYDNLTVTASFIPKEKIYTDADIVRGDAAFHVDRPVQLIHSHIIYDDVSEVSASLADNEDGNRMQLGVPYDRDFTFHNELLNSSISVLDDVDTTFTLKIDEKNGGFHTTSLKIYQDFVENYTSFEKITLTDLKGKEVVLVYDAQNHVFETEDKSVQYALSEGKWTITKEQMKDDLGLDDLKTMTTTGKGYQITGDTASVGDKTYYVDFDGYEDAAIGSNEIQKVESINYLDGIRTISSFWSTAKDDVLVYLSKMYFDTRITAGYNDGNESVKFDKVSTPLEDVRTKYNPNNNSSFGDNSELEIGYKGLGSFMVDFRQYLYAGSDLPTGATRQEHQSISYVKTQSFNTAANVNITVDLPYQYFETYYLKIDPRAKEYINSVTVIRKDGSQEVIAGADLQFGAEEKDDQGRAFCRLNLLKEEDSTRFSDDQNNFYRTPSDYGQEDPANPVEQVVINMDINQEQNHIEDGKTVANNPDFGT